MAEEKIVNVELTKSDLQNMLNWHTLAAINFVMSDEDETLRKKLLLLYRKEYRGTEEL